MQTAPPSLYRLREDLRIFPLGDRSGKGYVIEDPLRNLFFRIGQREYQFLCQLESHDNLDFISLQKDEKESFDHDEAMVILRWLAAKQLLQSLDRDTFNAVAALEKKTATPSLLSRLNPITFRLPLFNPDPLLNRSIFLLGWLAGPLFFLLWSLTGLTAMGLLLVNWEIFWAQSATIFAPRNLALLILIWLALKLAHELAHALACRRYGGRVYEFGVLFILFIPITYVNASSSWSFSSKWQRIHVAAAGMIMELFIAWLAIIYWAFSQGSTSAQLAYQTVLVAGISSILFNANPLMRFDGYYILSDLVKIPNLYGKALNAVHQLGRWFWFGIPPVGSRPTLPIICYGIMVYIWRILVLISLGFLASLMFSGWGILLTFLAIAAWVIQPIINLAGRLIELRAQNHRLERHFLIRVIILTAISGYLLFGLSLTPLSKAPAVVLFKEQYHIRTVTPGFVDELLVADGERVEKGQILAIFSNPELIATAAELQQELEIITIQKRQAQLDGDGGRLQILERKIEVLHRQKRQIDEDQDSLLVRAPGDGVVVASGLQNLLGLWMPRGEELLQIVTTGHKQLVASVSQDEIAVYQNRINERFPIQLNVLGATTYWGRLEKISPVASTELVHFAMGAPHQGALDVKARPGSTGYSLFVPRFSLYFSLPDDLKHRVRAGQTATIEAAGIKRSVASLFGATIRDWLNAKRDAMDQK